MWLFAVKASWCCDRRCCDLWSETQSRNLHNDFNGEQLKSCLRITPSVRYNGQEGRSDRAVGGKPPWLGRKATVKERERNTMKRWNTLTTVIKEWKCKRLFGCGEEQLWEHKNPGGGEFNWLRNLEHRSCDRRCCDRRCCDRRCCDRRCCDRRCCDPWVLC